MLRYLLTHDKPVLLLLLVYFVVRLPNLTLLPIFNDEAIYLDWGWRETHIPGMLYYSLYDGKQPLLMWIFGVFQDFFPDPLFAGRLVSVLTGACSLVGIYLIAKMLFAKNVAYLSSLFYIVIPLFVFFDRQALMESAIATVGVFACYCAIKLWTTNAQRFAYALGIVLGVGFWIKSSVLIFLAAFVILSGIVFWRSTQKARVIKHSAIVFAMVIATIPLLLINPDFWASFPRNAQYALTLAELARFPLVPWLQNVWANLVISFFYLTPPD